MKILIDPGHGGESLGTTKGYVPEKDLNLTVSLALYEEMKGEFEIHMTRYKDEFVSLEDRIKISHRVKPDIFISIHHNAYEDEAEPRSEIYTSWSVVSPSYDLAYIVEDNIRKYFKNREFLALPSKYTVLKSKARVKILSEIFFAEEVDHKKLKVEVDILKNSIYEFSELKFAKKPDPYRVFGLFSKPKGFLTTRFKRIMGNRVPEGDWVVIVGSGRVFWEGVEIVRKLGGKLYHFGMSVPPNIYETAMKISKTKYRKILILKYGNPSVRYYYTNREGERVAVDISNQLGYPIGLSSNYLCIHPRGIRIELTFNSLEVDKLIKVLP